MVFVVFLWVMIEFNVFWAFCLMSYIIVLMCFPATVCRHVAVHLHALGWLHVLEGGFPVVVLAEQR